MMFELTWTPALRRELEEEFEMQNTSPTYRHFLETRVCQLEARLSRVYYLVCAAKESLAGE